MSKILISGYYGFGNNGDDALLMSIVKGLKEKIPDCDITVLSANPAETASVYHVNAVNRWNLFEIIKNILKSDLLISGGGTLIQDGTSTKSLIYYLAVIMLASLSGLKIMLYSNGIGPLTKKSNIRLTKNILNRADMITLRDEASQKMLADIGVTKPDIVLTADPAFLLEKTENASALELIDNISENGRDFFIVSVRKWSRLPESFTSDLAEVIDYTAQKYDMIPVFLPMQMSADCDISREIMDKMTSECKLIDRRMATGELLAVISRARICIGMRLHTLIYAASQGVPIIGLVYDPKINGFMDYINQKMYISAEDADSAALRHMTDECMENYARIKGMIDDRVLYLRKKASENSDYAAGLLKGGAKNGK